VEELVESNKKKKWPSAAAIKAQANQSAAAVSLCRAKRSRELYDPSPGRARELVVTLEFPCIQHPLN